MEDLIKFLQHPIIIAIYGCIFFNAFAWFVEKNKADAKNEQFNWQCFKNKHLDNWLISILAIPIVLVYGKDIHVLNMFIFKQITLFLINRDLSFKWYDVFYASTVPFVEGLYFVIVTWVPIIKTKSTKLLTKWFQKKIDE